jgi:cytochrome c
MNTKFMKRRVQPSLLAGALFGALLFAGANAVAQPSADDVAKKIAANAGCFTCHSIKHQESKEVGLPVGPAWQDVAAQYRDKPGAADFLTRIVLEGSNPYASHWKNKAAGIAMPPNSVAISESNARQVVFWILSLK